MDNLSQDRGMMSFRRKLTIVVPTLIASYWGLKTAMASPLPTWLPRSAVPPLGIASACLLVFAAILAVSIGADLVRQWLVPKADQRIPLWVWGWYFRRTSSGIKFKMETRSPIVLLVPMRKAAIEGFDSAVGTAFGDLIEGQFPAARHGNLKWHANSIADDAVLYGFRPSSRVFRRIPEDDVKTFAFSDDGDVLSSQFDPKDRYLNVAIRRRDLREWIKTVRWKKLARALETQSHTDPASEPPPPPRKFYSRVDKENLSNMYGQLSKILISNGANGTGDGLYGMLAALGNAWHRQAGDFSRGGDMTPSELMAMYYQASTASGVLYSALYGENGLACLPEFAVYGDELHAVLQDDQHRKIEVLQNDLNAFGRVIDVMVQAHEKGDRRLTEAVMQATVLQNTNYFNGISAFQKWAFDANQRAQSARKVLTE